MKRLAKPQTVNFPNPEPEAEKPLVSDISIQRLIDSGLVSLDREMRNIAILSAKGKLDAASARDLRDHVKLLFELKEREDASLKDMTDEELAAALKD